MNGTDGGKILKPRSIERGEDVINLNIDWSRLTKKEVSFLKGLPSMIMQNGLGQTVAFMQCKKEAVRWLAPFTDLLLEHPPTKMLLEVILQNCDIRSYLYLQHEAIEYAGWMKKFAVAAQPEDTEEEEDET